MNDSDLGKEFGAAENSTCPQSDTAASSPPIPEVTSTGILIRKVFTVFKCFPDGTFELVSTNSWIDKAGLPQKEKKKSVREIPKTKLKNLESY